MFEVENTYVDWLCDIFFDLRLRIRDSDFRDMTLTDLSFLE